MLQLGFGLGALALLLLAFGMVGVDLAAAALVAGSVTVTALSVPSLQRHPRTPSSVDGALVMFVALALLLILIRALSPPIAWDSLVYHLTGPKLYSRGRSDPPRY